MKKFLVHTVFFSFLGWFVSLIFGFGLNFVGLLIMNIIFSFMVTANSYATQVSNNFPYFKLGFSFFIMFLVEKLMGDWLNEALLGFFAPTLLWKIFVGLGFVTGCIGTFGRKGNGTQSTFIETIGNLASTILIVLAFVFYWWKGGVAYIVAGIPLIFVEVEIVDFIFWRIKTQFS